MLLILTTLALALAWLAGIGSGILSRVALQITALLVFAVIFGRAAQRLHQPTVLGEILGGIILGPTVFGALAFAAQSTMFPNSGLEYQIVHSAIYLGLIAFVFTAGMEVNLVCLKQRPLSTAMTSISSILLPFALGFGLVVFLPGLWQSHRNLMIFALFMGTALSISALPVIARILMDLDLMKNELGGMIVTAAAINDVVGWSLFAVILSSLDSKVSLALNLVLTLGFFSLTALVIYIIDKNDSLEHPFHMGGLVDFIAVAILAVSVAAEALGAHGILGVFLAGVILSQRRKRSDFILRKTYPLVMGVLAPVYFASIGLKTNFATNFDLQIVLLVFFVACVGKILGAGMGAKASGMNNRASLAIGFGLNARGAMEIVLASVALDYGLIDQHVFVALVIMALATSMISGSMIQRLLKINSSAEVQARFRISDKRKTVQ